MSFGVPPAPARRGGGPPPPKHIVAPAPAAPEPQLAVRTPTAPAAGETSRCPPGGTLRECEHGT